MAFQLESTPQGSQEGLYAIRGRVPRSRTRPPLSSRQVTPRARLLLLLETYADVADLLRRHVEGRPSGKPGYKHLVRSKTNGGAGGLWDQGSYAALEHCLSRLRKHYPRIHRHVSSRYCCATTLAVHEISEKRVERGIDLLLHWMPAEIRVPPELVENRETLASPAMLTYLRRKKAA